MKKRLTALLGIVVLALVVRSLTGHFIAEHLDDPGWFQSGSYALFDRNAQDMLDGRSPLFWIDDPSRTDRIVYPPGYSWWLAAIYSLTGSRSPLSVQRLQVVLDSFSVLLLVGIGVSAFGWGTGYAAGFLGALSPLLALNGASPTADAPTSWLVLAAMWCLISAAERVNIKYAVAAGAVLGVACWFRVNPLFLFVAWSAALLMFTTASWQRGIKLSAAVTIATLLVVSPLVIRNLIVFYPEIAPTGLGIGWNLLAGIGETDRGAEFGVPCCDAGMVEQDRQAMNLSDGAPLELNYPDGIRRDRERGRRALGIIASHPIWYAGTMAARLWGHLKFFGAPVPNVGSMGFNVTAAKTLPADLRDGPLALFVNILGMVQSLWRFLELPLILVGSVLAFRNARPVSMLLASTVAYYLVTLAVGHSEIRYGLPMQAIFIVLAAAAVNYFVLRIFRSSKAYEPVN